MRLKETRLWTKLSVLLISFFVLISLTGSYLYADEPEYSEAPEEIIQPDPYADSENNEPAPEDMQVEDVVEPPQAPSNFANYGLEEPIDEDDETYIDSTANGHVIIVPERSVGAAPYMILAEYFQQLGYSTSIMNVDSKNMVADAQQIAKEVEKIRRQHPGRLISIVGHGMGGISARWYLKELNGHPNVETYVAISTPQYGLPHACLTPLSQGVCADSYPLNVLKEGDDTPGDTFYVSIRSTEDLTSGDLDGGQCRMNPVLANPALAKFGIEHFLQPAYSSYLLTVKLAVSKHCDGVYVDAPIDSIHAGDTFFPDRNQYLVPTPGSQPEILEPHETENTENNLPENNLPEEELTQEDPGVEMIPETEQEPSENEGVGLEMSEEEYDSLR